MFGTFAGFWCCVVLTFWRVSASFFWFRNVLTSVFPCPVIFRRVFCWHICPVMFGRYDCSCHVIRYKFSAFFVTPTLPALSRVPPAVCPSLLESATTDSVCTSFLQSLSAYVHTEIPHTYVHTSFLQSLSTYVHTAIPYTYKRRRLIHITIQSRSTNTRFTYVQSSTPELIFNLYDEREHIPRVIYHVRTYS